MSRRCSTICLPGSKEDYQLLVQDPKTFRAWIDENYQLHPELFPKDFHHGYHLKDFRPSTKSGLRTRRITLKATGEAFSVRPSCVLPYHVALTDEIEPIFFLHSFGVPFWALEEVFGQDDNKYYRALVALGRNSIVGTTIRKAQIPQHLIADEHHQKRDGEKNYIATVVAQECCLTAQASEGADEASLKDAYGIFKEEAQNVDPDYQPETVNTDGWTATMGAWLSLFAKIVLIRCYLHGWLSMRARGKLNAIFFELSLKVWEAFHAPSKASFSQRIRRLREWAKQASLSVWLKEKVLRLCSRGSEYCKAYDHPGAYRTSSMLDRVMRKMNHYFDNGQHLHGSKPAAILHGRAWALLYNFCPQHPDVAKKHSGLASPAERLNQHRYHDNWLHNLLVSASLGGYRR